MAVHAGTCDDSSACALMPAKKTRKAMGPERSLNRELSWLDFNARLLELAADPETPLLERVKFCSIFSSNLDEFFMVRVAGLQEYVDAGIEKPREDGRSPAETIAAIGAAVREQTHRQTRVIDRVLRPALEEHGIRIQTCDQV